MPKAPLSAALCLLTALGTAMHAEAQPPPPKSEQLAELRTKQILVPMWGWPEEEMARAAREFGYEVVNAPHGNDLEVHKRQAAIWGEAGLDMIVRPHMPVEDPWNLEDVAQGCAAVNEVIRFHDDNPRVRGFLIAWGLYGEGGFPFDYVFSDNARAAFNAWMDTPGAPLPEPPGDGQPGALRWVKWLEFRSKTLREFRTTYVASAKEHTDKLVGTWSEFYPIANHLLNMGEAPGADFLMYDLSFGDVTTNQRIAFAETHGDMQHFETFEAWRNHELPMMAKAAGEGVVPVGFQFPMRRGHATDFLKETTVFIDAIEDEYSLRIGPDIRELVDTLNEAGVREPEVAVVYQSFAAGALPGGDAFDFYYGSVRMIEALLRQMGVDLRQIPYEHLATADLSAYKLVIVADPMYLNNAMRANLEAAPRVLYSGEYGLTHHDPATASGDYYEGWSAEGELGGMPVRYLRAPESAMTVPDADHPLLEGVHAPEDATYPADQMAVFPEDAVEPLLLVGGYPMLALRDGGRTAHVCNRLFNHAWHSDARWMEDLAYGVLRNLMDACGVTRRVVSPPAFRANNVWPYGSYGVTGWFAWNALDKPVPITLRGGREITIPSNGWTLVPRPGA